MPLYDLRCKACKHEYQKLVSFAKRDGLECPQCGSKEKEQIYKVTVKGPVSTSCGPSGSGFT